MGVGLPRGGRHQQDDKEPRLRGPLTAAERRDSGQGPAVLPCVPLPPSRPHMAWDPRGSPGGWASLRSQPAEPATPGASLGDSRPLWPLSLDAEVWFLLHPDGHFLAISLSCCHHPTRLPHGKASGGLQLSLARHQAQGGRTATERKTGSNPDRPGDLGDSVGRGAGPEGHGGRRHLGTPTGAAGSHAEGQTSLSASV